MYAPKPTAPLDNEGAHGLKNESNERQNTCSWGRTSRIAVYKYTCYINFYLYLYHFSLIKVNGEAKKWVKSEK